jgi:hypothetical protein
MRNSRLFILEPPSKDGLSNQMRMQKAGNSALLTLRGEKFSKCKISLAKEKINKQNIRESGAGTRANLRCKILPRSIWTRKYLQANIATKKAF